jgi:acetyl/propionyl-CoA carboxylase alpha subunit
VRIDTALRDGEVVGTSYDPLLAKVIAHASDRERALARLRAALGEVEIVGVVTNLGFLIDALGHADVVAAGADTDWVETMWRPDPPPLPDGAAAADVDARDPWRAFGDGTDAAGRQRRVAVAGGWAQFNGWAYRLSEDELDPVALAPPGGSLTAPMPASVLRVGVAVGDQVAAGEVLLVLEAMKVQIQIRTPTDGTVAAIHIRDGDAVVAGQTLVEVRP